MQPLQLQRTKRVSTRDILVPAALLTTLVLPLTLEEGVVSNTLPLAGDNLLPL